MAKFIVTLVIDYLTCGSTNLAIIQTYIHEGLAYL